MDQDDHSEALASILAGADDEDAVYALYQDICESEARTPSQQLFVTAWELSSFIGGDGFEFLYEQGEPIEKWYEVFAQIGDQLVRKCRSEADSDGGVFRVGRRISPEESAILDSVETAFALI